MSRTNYDRHFTQTNHGDREHGQTPTAMFLETWASHNSPDVAVIRRSKAGVESTAEVIRGREELLAWAVRFADGNLTTFDQDDERTTLSIEPWEDFRYCRLEFRHA